MFIPGPREPTRAVLAEAGQAGSLGGPEVSGLKKKLLHFIRKAETEVFYWVHASNPGCARSVGLHSGLPWVTRTQAPAPAAFQGSTSTGSWNWKWEAGLEPRHSDTGWGHAQQRPRPPTCAVSSGRGFRECALTPVTCHLGTARQRAEIFGKDHLR